MATVQTHLVVGDSLMVDGLLPSRYGDDVQASLRSQYPSVTNITILERHYQRADKLEEWGSGEPCTVLTASGEVPDA